MTQQSLRPAKIPLLFASNSCEVDGRPGYDICIDTGITVCYDCVYSPGILGGLDHRLPGNTLMCAHQGPGLRDSWAAWVPRLDTYESVRHGAGYPGILHWPAGRCWCAEFHRDQAAALEFDPWRRGLSVYAARPQLLG